MAGKGCMCGTKYSRVGKVNFVEDSLYKHLLSPLLNTLSLIIVLSLNILFYFGSMIDVC